MADPLEYTPAAWKDGNLNYCSGMTLALATKMIQAGEAEANRLKLPMSIAVADCGGHTVALHRMDNALIVGIQIAQDKAYTAVFGKMHTWNWSPQYRVQQLIPLFFHERWITFAGGFPLIKDKNIWGGLGVSGGIFEDVLVARAAIEAGGFSTKEANEYIDMVKNQKVKG